MPESFDMEKHLLEMRGCLPAEGKAMEMKQLFDFTIKELRKINLDPEGHRADKKRYRTAVNRLRLRSYNTVVTA